MSGNFAFRTAFGGMIGLLAIRGFGGPQAIEALTMIVVCTAGLSLLVLVPAAYLIGLICTIWFIPYGSQSAKTQEKVCIPVMNPAAGFSTRAALELFIYKGLKHGQEWQMLHDQCINAGWPEEFIQAAFLTAQAREHCDR